MSALQSLTSVIVFNNMKTKKKAKLSSIVYHKSTAPRPKRLVFPTSCLSTSLLAPIIHPALPSRKRRSIPTKHETLIKIMVKKKSDRHSEILYNGHNFKRGEVFSRVFYNFIKRVLCASISFTHRSI